MAALFRNGMSKGLSGFLSVVLFSSSLAAAEIDDARATVERIRQLTFTGPVTQKTITRQELRSFLVKQMEKELPAAPAEYLRVLDALDLIENKPDTFDQLLALYEAQVLAFYDPSTHVYYALDQPPAGAEFHELISTGVAIHELTHALQDQRFNAGEKLAAMKGNSDAQMAYHALIEGEATLVMMAAFLEPLGQSLDAMIGNEELFESMAMLASLNPGVPAGVPPYFVESMKFPYLEGLKLVITAYRKGGWKAIDALHRNPPSSTEQVLHPDEFLNSSKAIVPSAVQAKDRPVLLTEKMGEFSWRFLLGEKAASGWGGDTVQVVKNGDGKYQLFIETNWDTDADAREFADAYGTFLKSQSRVPTIRRQKRVVSVSYLAP